MSGTRSDVRSDVRADARADEGVGSTYGFWQDGTDNIISFGTDQRLEVDDFDVTFNVNKGSSGSISAIFTLAATSNLSGTVWRWDAADKLHVYGKLDGGAVEGLTSSATYATGDTVLARTVKSGTSLILYIDGQVAGSTTLTTSAIDYSDQFRETAVGAYRVAFGAWTANIGEGVVFDLVVKDGAGNVILRPPMTGSADADLQDEGSSGLAGAGLTIPDENATIELDDTDTTWGASGMSVTATGGELVFSATSAPTAGFAQIDASAPTGDFIMYFKGGVDSASGDYMHFDLYDTAGASGRVQLWFNYNIAIGSGEANRISLRTITGTNTLHEHAGLVLDTTPTRAEIALHYDSVHGFVNLWVKTAGKWVFVGASAMDQPEDINKIRVTSGGTDAADGYFEYIKICSPNIVAVGDSICAGQTLFNPDPDEIVGDDDSNSTWMAHALDISGGLVNNLIVNRGFRGDTSEEINDRIAAVLSSCSPRVVVLHSSTNDFTGAVSLADRTTEVQASLTAITGASAQAVLLNSIYPNADAVQDHESATAYYLEWWDDYLSTVTGVTASIDIMQAVLAGDGFISDDCAHSDGVHPNLVGYQRIGEFIAAVLLGVRDQSSISVVQESVPRRAFDGTGEGSPNRAVSVDGGTTWAEEA